MLTAGFETGGVKLLEKKDWPGLSVEKLQEQIDVRLKIIPQMVGWLYPSIMEDQIVELKEAVENGGYQEPPTGGRKLGL